MGCSTLSPPLYHYTQSWQTFAHEHVSFGVFKARSHYKFLQLHPIKLTTHMISPSFYEGFESNTMLNTAETFFGLTPLLWWVLHFRLKQNPHKKATFLGWFAFECENLYFFKRTAVIFCSHTHILPVDIRRRFIINGRAQRTESENFSTGHVSRWFCFEAVGNMFHY